MYKKISLLKFHKVEKSGLAARTCSDKESDSLSFSPFFLYNKEDINYISWNTHFLHNFYSLRTDSACWVNFTFAQFFQRFA